VAHAFKETQLDGSFLNTDMVLVRDPLGFKKSIKITMGCEFSGGVRIPWKAGEMRYPSLRAEL
jgi:hypothetical protein